jgi:hypothetical protein
MLCDSPIDLKNQLPEIPLRSLPDILPPGNQKRPEKEYSLRYMLEIYLAWMESESEFRVEKFSNPPDTLFQIFTIRMDQDKVIDISPIVFHFQSFLHEYIELMHRDIREYLTREIPDRESASLT